jgi:hypothetical protein
MLFFYQKILLLKKMVLLLLRNETYHIAKHNIICYKPKRIITMS